MQMSRLFVICCTFTAAVSVASLACAETPKGAVQVYLLAGQSNMQGQGVVDLDHPQYYNGGKGTLAHVMADPKKAAQFKHLKNTVGEWSVRDDVWIRHQTKSELKKGKLTIGFTSYGGSHHIGPELQFGHIIGDATVEPVLLIKTAWGGKSLHVDFRPPSAGGEIGPYYQQMLAETKTALENLGKDFPELAGREVEIAGFVWMQGWNDMFNADALKDYQANLVCLAKDIREHFKNPDLPIVIGELGNGGADAGKNMLEIRRAQKAACEDASLKGNIAFAPTAAFARPAKESPNVGHGHHWFGNAESYFLIGDALGKAMLSLQKDAP